jgi:hypothetical protein
VGYPDFTGDSALIPVTSRPRTPQVVDEYGNPLVYGTTDNADATFPIDSRVVEFIEYGVVNGSFARGPADPNHDITDINPMPDWTGPTQVVGGAMTAGWAIDATTPSGYALQIHMPTGTQTGDEVRFEQLVPIGGSRFFAYGDVVRFVADKVSGAGTDNTVKLVVQYLDINGNAVGSAVTQSTTIGAAGPYLGFSTSWGGGAFFSSIARTLRIRISVVCTSGALNDINIYEVRRAPSQQHVVLPDGSTPQTYNPALISYRSGAMTLTAVSGTVTVDGVAQVIQMGGLGGLAFPATQIPITDANTLDDYEEGTWTPALSYATVGTSSWAVTTAVGWYTKIGRLVTLQGLYTGVPTNGSAAGNLQLTTLPFTPSATANTNSRISANMGGYTNAAYTAIHVSINPGSTTATFVGGGSGTAVTNLAVGDIPSAGTVVLRFVGSYIV